MKGQLFPKLPYLYHIHKQNTYVSLQRKTLAGNEVTAPGFYPNTTKI